jgi:hypothetical protein
MKFAMLLALLFGCTFAGPVRAQDGSPSSQLREVTGVACDKDDKPVDSAVVYLKNDRTLTVRTYITGDKGDYHFSGLDPNVDYEIHAEHDDMTSANHTVSSLDGRKAMNVTLKINKEKKKTDK